MIDFYKVLGVERTASKKEIKEAYYRLAKKYHPDLVPSNDISLKKFNIITQAYKVLADLDKRLDYKIKLDEAEENSILEITRKKILRYAKK